MISNPSKQKIWLCLYFTRLPLEVFSRSMANPSTSKQLPINKNSLPRKDKEQPAANRALAEVNRTLPEHKEQAAPLVADLTALTTPVCITSAGRIYRSNTAACAAGIETGSIASSAYAISNNLKCIDRNEEKEIRALRQLAHWAYQFTPNVAVREPHCLLLDITGCLTLFTGLANLKKQIIKNLSPLGYSAVIGINLTPLAALMSAEAGIKDNVEKSPDDVLSQVSIDYLRIAPKVIGQLQRMGIQTLEALFRLPPSGLNRRFGSDLDNYLSKLKGLLPDPQTFIPQKASFHSELNFMADISNLQSLAFPMKRLIGEFCGFMQNRQLHAHSFNIELTHRSHPAKEITVELAKPDNDQNMFLALTQLQLDKIHDMPEVDSLALKSTQFCPAKTNTDPLFPEDPGCTFEVREQDKNSAYLLNILTARLGTDACFCLALGNDHRPEKNWQAIRVKNTPGETINQDLIAARPLFLLNQPKKLHRHTARSLKLIQGPERICFGWWDENGFSRDYYICQHSNGAIYWVFYQGYDSEWYLHGLFS